MFSSVELQALISGNPETGIDVADLRRNTQYNGYDDHEPVIEHFWQILASLEPRLQRQFLSFVTGTTAVPLLGFVQLEPKFCIQRAHFEDDQLDALPTSNTCMNLLKLTPFEDPVVMREKIIYAIENAVGFWFS